MVEAIANLENKGQVRHSKTHFGFDIRYMLATDPVAAKGSFLVSVLNKAAEGSWLPQGWDETRCADTLQLWSHGPGIGHHRIDFTASFLASIAIGILATS